jgi:hypothetical protein
MPTVVFGEGAIQTAYVSYIQLDLRLGNITLVWPSSYVNVPYTQNGINYNVLAASIEVITGNSNTNTITLPDATMQSVGSNFIITNIGDSGFNLLNANGDLVVNIPIAGLSSVNSYWVQLVNNSTPAGTWSFVQFGAGNSSAQASALKGNGLTVISTTLNTDIPTQNKSSAYTVLPSDRANLIIWTNGTDNITLPPITSAPSGFYLSFNNGTTSASPGIVTIITNPSDSPHTTIDNKPSISLNSGQSLSVISSGSNWWSLGLGFDVLSNTFIDGSAMNPSIAFSMDTDTGIYRNGTPYLGFTVSGTQVGTFFNAPDISTTSFSVGDQTPANNTIITSSPTNSTISYAGVNAITIAPITGTVTFPAQQTTLDALMPSAPAKGDLLYYNGTHWVILPIAGATMNQKLTVITDTPIALGWA